MTVGDESMEPYQRLDAAQADVFRDHAAAEEDPMREAVRNLTQAITEILDGKLHSLWLYGSVVLDDFRLGWSDIDFLALAEEPITQTQAEQLLFLRQRLSERHPGNPYYRCFEGIIVPKDEYVSGAYTRLVYWGTSGQRVTNRYAPDVFAQYELAKYGRAVSGKPEHGLFREPTREELVLAVRSHLSAIRSCAAETDESLYSCGWLLDIARCIFTLRTGDVIAKTRAGRWALEAGLFPEAEALRQTLAIREAPLAYRDSPEIKTWLRGLGPTVQRCADVLEAELRKAEKLT